MRRVSILTLAIVLSASGAGQAAAQWNVARFDAHPNRVYASVGLDPAFVSSVGYGRVVRVQGHGFQLGGEVSLAAAQLDTRDFRVRLGVQTSLVHWRSVHFTGSATAITRGTDNVIFRGLNFGADFTGAIGVYRPRWFAAGDFGKDKAVITHITHSDWYRTHYYPDAKDGWYLDAGGTYHYGFMAGVALGRVELVGRFGWLTTEDYNDLNPPLYLSMGAGFAF
jgi:hypothetical protein